MHHKNLTIYLLALLLCLSAGCKRDIIGEEDIDTIIPLPGTKVVSSVIGLVVDEAGIPLEGVTTSLRGEDIITDQNGYFRFAGIETSTLSGGYLSFQKSGYYDNYKYNYATEAGDQDFMRVTMMEFPQAWVVDAAAGGTRHIIERNSVVGDFPARIAFPENAFVDENGSSYQGQVSVYARWLDPTSEELPDRMPGDLRAINAEQELVQLSTFGMIAVELRDENDRELELADGKTAIIKMTIPDELVESIPDSLPTWSFNKENGYWTEEGVAVQDSFPNYYRAEVSHFSYWNYDAPWPIINWCAHLTYPDGTPAANAKVIIKIAGSGVSKCGWTNNRGKVSGSLPKDQLLELIFPNSECEGQNYSLEIGPFSEDENTPNIEVPFPSSAQLITCTGVLSCDGAPVSNGYVMVQNGYSTEVAPTDENGSYNLDVSYCSPNTLTIQGFNIDNLSAGEVMEMTNPQNPLQLDQETCDGVELPEYIKYYIGGTEYFIQNPLARIVNGTLEMTDEDIFQTNCWDSNGNGIQDADEDNDGNGIYNVWDCSQPAFRINVPNAALGFNEPVDLYLTHEGIWNAFELEPGFSVTIDTLETVTDGLVMGTFEGERMIIGPSGLQAVEVTGEFKINLSDVLRVFSVEGKIWVDVDENNLYDPAVDEFPQPTNQLRISAIDINGNTAKFGVISDQGTYKISWLQAGSYKLRTYLPSNYELVEFQAGTDDCAMSDINPDIGDSEVFTIADEDISCMDVGLLESECRVEDIPFGGGGSCNPGVTLFFNPSPDSQVNTLFINGEEYTTQSDSFQFYGPAIDYQYTINDEFEQLCAGEFQLVDAPNGFPFIDCIPIVDTDCLMDAPAYRVELSCETTSDIDNYIWSNGAIGEVEYLDQPGLYSVTITTEDGCQGLAEFDLDFSEFRTISGKVWEDNEPGVDGLFDDGIDALIVNQVVNLADSSDLGTILQTVMTNAEGYYEFTNLEMDIVYAVSLELETGYEYSPFAGQSGTVAQSDFVDPLTGVATINLSTCDIKDSVNIPIRKQ